MKNTIGNKSFSLQKTFAIGIVLIAEVAGAMLILSRTHHVAADWSYDEPSGEPIGI